MTIFPMVETVATVVETIKERGINFLFDFSLGDFVTKDGKFIELTGDAAVAFWVEKTLRTEYERAPVYWNTGYGTKLESLRGTVLPKTIAKNMFKSNVESALLKHERIKSIDNFTFTQENEQVTLSFGITLNAITEATEVISSSEDGYTRLSTLQEIANFLGITLTSNASYTTSLNL